MASGGKRPGAGRPTTPGSELDLRRAAGLKALPAEGYKGRAPAYPLPAADLGDARESRAFRKRELELWRAAWRTPQAAAWATPAERWRTRSVAMWVRVSVRCEAGDAPASLLAQLHRFADQIGMTQTGLAEMGWKVATDDLAARKPTPANAAPTRARRLRVVPDVSTPPDERPHDG